MKQLNTNANIEELKFFKNRELSSFAEDLKDLLDYGFTLPEAIELLKVAELRRISRCIKHNEFDGNDYLRVTGWIETTERY